MKHYLTTILIIFILIISGGAVLASDITHAAFYGSIAATNNSTLASTVSVPFTANTTSLINGGMLNATATNVAVNTDTGTDTAFMPGYGTNPWIVFYDTVAANSVRNATIYTGAVTGGKLAYFPDTAGMAVLDNASIEPSANFSISMTSYIDMTQIGQNLFNKSSAITCNITGSDNITATITDNATIVNSNMELLTGWTGGSRSTGIAPHGNTYSWVVAAIGNAYQDLAWNDAYKGLSYTFTCWVSTGAAVNSGRIGINDGVGTTYSSYVIANGVWQQLTVSRILSGNATLLRLYLYCDVSGDTYFDDVTPPTISISKSGISSGEKNINIYSDSVNFKMDINGVNVASRPTGGVINNSNNWAFGSSATPYIISTNVTIGGVLKGSWKYNYAATFPDDSGNGNTATPTFRTTSSDADVSAALTSFLPVTQAKSDSDPSTSWPSIMTATPDQPSTTYTENATPGVFFQPLVHAIWPLSGIPESFFWYGFTFVTIILAGLLVFSFFASKGQSALLIKIILMMAIMIFWSLPGPNVYGMYIPIYFGMWCFGIMALSRSYGW